MIGRTILGVAAFGLGFLTGCNSHMPNISVRPPQETHKSQEIFKGGDLVCTPEFEAQGLCEKQKR